MARPSPKPRRDPDRHYNRGVELHRAGKLAEAEAEYRAALALSPKDKDALNNLTVALRQQGREAETFELMQRLLALAPDDPAAHNNFGILLLARGEPAEAAAHFTRALALSPAMMQAMNNLGNARTALGDRAGAVEAFRDALAHDAGYAEAHANLGNLLRLEGRNAEAIVHNRRAAELAPTRKEMFEGLGQTLTQMGDLEGAIASLERAVAIDPTYVEAQARLLAARQQACAWDGFAVRRDSLVAHARARIAAGRNCGVEPHFAITLADDPVFQREVAAAKSRRIERDIAGAAARMHFAHSRDTPPRLRIGYASSHFSDAPTGHLVAGLLAAHDRDKVEVVGYMLGADDGSDYRRRIESACDRFVSLRNVPTEDAARRIHEDGINVLVDLRGYANGQRAEVLALRPAPVQTQLVGYPGTMAAPFIDYLIADAEVAREPADFAEAVVMMPGSYLATDNKQKIGAAPSRAECALPDGAFVFCCFNTNYKIEPVIFAAWMEILRAVPNAVLWLIRSNAPAEGNLRRAAAAAGIDPARLIFAPRMAKAQHLARHVHADLFLDTHSVNAHTTAVDALWAGLPVLTWPGRSFVARVGASVVAAAGMEELIAADRNSYVAIAVALGRDPAAARALKDRLAATRCAPGTLFDTAGYARRLEAAYAEMWRRFAAGLAPAAFTVSE